MAQSKSNDETSKRRTYSDFQTEIPKSLWKSDRDAMHCSMIECGARFNHGDEKHNCRRCGRVICKDCGRFLLYLRDAYGNENACRACGLCIRLAEGYVPDEAFAVFENQESEHDVYHAAKVGLFSCDAIGRPRVPVRPSAADVPPLRKSFDSSSKVHGCISEEDEANGSPLRRGLTHIRRSSNEPQRPDDVTPDPSHQPRRTQQQSASRNNKIHKSTSLSSLRGFFSRAASNSSAGSGRAEDDATVDVRYNGGLHIRWARRRSFRDRKSVV